MSGLYINTNVGSLAAQQSLGQATEKLNSAMKKLSTGLRINTASDDAAGLSISEKIKTQINGSDVASDNCQTGINMMQVAESDMGVMQDNLQRIRDLAVQAANAVYSTAERKALDDEVQERLKEIDRISKSSSFSHLKLLDGTVSSMTTFSLQIGTNASASTNAIDIKTLFSKVNCSTLSITQTATSSSVSTAAKARTFLEKIDTAINTLSTKRGKIGATVNRLESTIERLAIRKENMEATRSRIKDTDVASETSEMTKQQVLQQASSSVLAQANQAPSIALSLI